jgi:hypothetical protein
MPPPTPLTSGAPLASKSPDLFPYSAPNSAAGQAGVGGDAFSTSPAASSTGAWNSANEPNKSIDLFAGLGDQGVSPASTPQNVPGTQSFPGVQGYPASGAVSPAQPYTGGYTSGAPAQAAFTAPAFGAPSYGAPSYGTPGYQAPQQAPSYGAPSYSAPGYGNPYAAPTSGYPSPGGYGSAGGWGSGVAPHRGNTILTLGIIGLATNLVGYISCCCCAPLYLVFGVASIAMGVPAWIMANSDLRAMNEGRMDPSGQGATKTGMILGIICVALTVLTLITVAALYAFGFAMNFSEFQEGFNQGFEQSFEEQMQEEPEF